MRRYIPSSTALKCFEASVRHLSFTKAAEELHLTQSAVSRQIRNLEEFLSRDLFIRLNKRLVLTGTGAAYYKEVVPLLDRMENASLRMLHREDEKTTLTLSALPTLASYWLMPLLAEFQRLHPQFQIKVRSLDDAAKIDPDAVDVILHYGGDHWPRAVSHQLMREDVLAVCSPLLLERMDVSKSVWQAEDVTQFPFLHLSSRINAWPDWMVSQGLESGSFAGASFAHFHMLLEAAKNSMGVAILPCILAQKSLASGELVAPFGGPVATPHEYLLSYPVDKADLEQVVVFRDWLLATLEHHKQN
ncbi:LysR substrate-binding domain-containing protein [Marinomonas aquiplantarum]|uniref:LysR family glycine cleavage system transcriptional activator n=1 Tax=Marinomonas aquiplantarum TaxID=491951 RepID=A0A366D3Q0_9GAMM|nr:LysR substrate-binding domain-containing protein [Marinomonas aquiplantarum]RBO84693.1 LysR family glycine cleavage system transcriptional activator [Marinomonas aquiplantarum]